MSRFIKHLSDFFAVTDDDDDFELPLDESGKLIRPIGTVRAVEHSFKTRSAGQGSPTGSPQQTEVLPLDDESRALLEIAKAVRDKAYAKYSGFHVGAVLVAASGQVYPGVNMENASYPAGLCAERAAFAAAITAGEREFSAIAIIGSDDDAPCYPCGICRQVMAEFCPPEFPVILSDGVYSLGSLLPHSFEL
ncbi:MAG: cytidine deaminase [Oscillospiraceae bacterium]|nr:cytidine deaminase [Oscillospiraceae bacterium]